jgi:hypothetical protein
MPYKQHSWLGTRTSRELGGIMLNLWPQTCPISAMKRPCKCFSQVSKMPILSNNQVNSFILTNVTILNIFHNTSIWKSNTTRWIQ